MRHTSYAYNLRLHLFNAVTQHAAAAAAAAVAVTSASILPCRLCMNDATAFAVAEAMKIYA